MGRRINGKTTVDISMTDRDRINALAAELTERGPGKFGHRETIRYLLDERAALLAALAPAPAEVTEEDHRW